MSDGQLCTFFNLVPCTEKDGHPFYFRCYNHIYIDNHEIFNTIGKLRMRRFRKSKVKLIIRSTSYHKMQKLICFIWRTGYIILSLLFIFVCWSSLCLTFTGCIILKFNMCVPIIISLLLFSFISKCIYYHLNSIYQNDSHHHFKKRVFIILNYYRLLSFKFRILQTPSTIGSIVKHIIIIICASNALFQLIFVKKMSGGQIDPHRRSRGVAFCRRSSVN